MTCKEQNHSCNYNERSSNNFEDQEYTEGDELCATQEINGIDSDYSQKDQISNSGIFYQITTKMKEIYFKLNLFQKILMICGFGLFSTELVKLFTTNYSVPFFLGIGIPVIIFSLFAFTYKKEKSDNNSATN